MAEQQPQSIPVRLYERGDHLMLAAPMPGLEPENITVRIDGKQVTIRGEYRGPGQERVNLLVNEWQIGRYFRQITLPEMVNSQMVNATYGNGVLVLSMPKSEQGAEAQMNEFELQPVHSTRGEHIGHTGKGMRATTTEEGWKARAKTARGAGSKG